MAWVALDRVVRASRNSAARARRGLAQGAPGDPRRRVANGFDAERNTFVQAYGRKELDASLLMIPLVHFLPATDPRMRGTIARDQERADA